MKDLYLNLTNPDYDDVGRQIFISCLLAQREPHFGVHSWNSRVRAEEVVSIWKKAGHPCRLRFSADLPQGHELVFMAGPYLVYVRDTGEGNFLYAWVGAPSPGTLSTALALLKRSIKVIKPKPVVDTDVSVNFLYMDQGHAASFGRRIAAPGWGEISGNYAASAVPALKQLVGAKLSKLSGHVGVLHGPVGTGKTHYLRALMKGWRGQAEFTYVIDPEDLFRNARYMVDVLARAAHSGRTWSVIICEDAEEFITPGAKGEVGQALARILNLGDGLLGQGLRTILLFTTNVAYSELHPAIMRAGRCFGDYEVPLLPPAEATAWLGQPVTEATSLADLYQLRSKEGKSNEQSSGADESPGLDQ